MLLTFDDTISMEQATSNYRQAMDKYLGKKDLYSNALDEYIEEKSSAKPDKRKVRQSLSDVQKLYNECLAILNDELLKARQDLFEVIAKNEANKMNRNPEKDKRKKQKRRADIAEAKYKATKEIQKLQSELDDERSEKEKNIYNDQYDNEEERKLNAKAQFTTAYRNKLDLRNELMKYDQSDAEYARIKEDLKEAVEKLNKIESQYPEYAADFAKEESAIRAKFQKNLKDLDDSNPMISQYVDQIQDLQADYEDICKKLAKAEIEEDTDLEMTYRSEKRKVSSAISSLVAKLKRLDSNNEVITNWENTLKDKNYKNSVSKSVNQKNVDQKIKEVRDLMNQYEQILIDGYRAKDEAEYGLAEDNERKLKTKIDSLITELDSTSSSFNKQTKAVIATLKDTDWKNLKDPNSRLRKLFDAAKTKYNSVDEVDDVLDKITNGVYVIYGNGLYLTGYRKTEDGNHKYTTSGKVSEAIWSDNQQIMENYLNQIGLSGQARVVKLSYPSKRDPKYNEAVKTMVRNNEPLTQDEVDNTSFGNGSGNYVSGSNGFGSSGSSYNNSPWSNVDSKFKYDDKDQKQYLNTNGF